MDWLPVCIWVQFKMLFLTFKIFHGKGLGYLRDHLFPITSACPTRSGNGGILWIPSARDLHMMGPSDMIDISIMVPFSWNILPLEIRLMPSFLTFWKCPKTWLYNQVWGSQGTVDMLRYARWLFFLCWESVYILMIFIFNLDFIFFYISCFYISCCSTVVRMLWDKKLHKFDK